MSPISGSERTLAAQELLLVADEIEAIVWRHVAGQPGVSMKQLWADEHGDSYAGLMRIAPGAAVKDHTHQYAVHHVWVIEGSCSVRGTRLGTGSYSFVPAGVGHGTDEAGSDGCTMFYLYQVAEID